MGLQWHFWQDQVSASAQLCSPSLFIFFRFIVDRRIFVVGFGLYGSIHGPSEYFTYFTTFHPHLLVSGMMWPSSWYTPALAGSLGQMKFHSPGESFEERLRFSVMEMNVISDGTNATFRAMFKEPLEIQPNTNYTAVSFTPLQHLVKELIEIGLIFYHYQVSTLKGLDSHYGTKGLRKVAFTISLFSLHCKLNGTCAGDGWLSQWRQGDISVQLRGGQQQWHLRGRRTDSRDYFLYLKFPCDHMARAIIEDYSWCDKIVVRSMVNINPSEHVLMFPNSQWCQFRANMFHFMWFSAVWRKPLSEIFYKNIEPPVFIDMLWDICWPTCLTCYQ